MRIQKVQSRKEESLNTQIIEISNYQGIELLYPADFYQWPVFVVQLPSTATSTKPRCVIILGGYWSLFSVCLCQKHQIPSSHQKRVYHPNGHLRLSQSPFYYPLELSGSSTDGLYLHIDHSWSILCVCIRTTVFPDTAGCIAAVFLGSHSEGETLAELIAMTTFPDCTTNMWFDNLLGYQIYLSAERTVVLRLPWSFLLPPAMDHRNL